MRAKRRTVQKEREGIEKRFKREEGEKRGGTTKMFNYLCPPPRSPNSF